MLIYKAFRYKLSPTTIQESLFYRFTGATRWVWNVMLAEQKRRYVEGEKWLGKHNLMRWLTELKANPDLRMAEYHSQSGIARAS